MAVPTNQVAVSVSVLEGASVLHNVRMVRVASEATNLLTSWLLPVWDRLSHVLDVSATASAISKKIAAIKKAIRPPVIFFLMKPQSDNFFRCGPCLAKARQEGQELRGLNCMKTTTVQLTVLWQLGIWIHRPA